ncbi:MAG: hypothetical protein KDA78_07645 [Planctomycetaceae bacterium]|nr:hypothetical protein [Planctomycetaceae bacterium]
MGIIIVIVILLPLGLFFYMRSVNSRKSYQCPNCGETLTVELMEATRCNVCGTVLKKE